MHGGYQGDGRGEGMRCQHHVIGVSKGSDPTALGEAAGPGDIRLDDIDGALCNEFAESIQSDLGFIASNGGAQSACHLGAASDVIGGYRFLDPIECIRLQGLAHLDRQGWAPGTVDIDHQLGVTAQCPAYGLHTGQIFLEADHAEFVLRQHFAQICLR
jgi:hypothetical protein